MADETGVCRRKRGKIRERERGKVRKRINKKSASISKKPIKQGEKVIMEIMKIDERELMIVCDTKNAKSI